MATTTQTPPIPAHTLPNSPQTPPAQLPHLRSNHGPYLPPTLLSHMRPSPRDTPLPVLRARYARDGYIWLKNLIPRAAVLDMREHYFTHLAPTGILKPGTTPRDGIFNPGEDPLLHAGIGASDLPEEQEKVTKLTEAHASAFYQQFLAHPDFRGFIREFMGWERETMVLRNMLRHNCPGGLSTGIHYDKLFLRGGKADFLTAWVPIGDVAVNGGGLVYLEGSSGLGREIEEDFGRRAQGMSESERVSAFNVNMSRDGTLGHDMSGFGGELAGRGFGGAWGGKAGQEGGRRWLVGEYEAGDVVFHDPYMIHGSAKNEDPMGRIRLSSDVRFYEEGADMDERWNVLWTPGDGL